MLLLGHLGIGSRLVRVFRLELPTRWVLLGTVLPDLVDKPLYYLCSFWTGESGLAVGLISGTRTFGHSGLLLLALLAWGLSRGSLRTLALTVGVASHLVLDLAGDQLELFERSGTVQALLFPLLGPHFCAAPARSALDHFSANIHKSYVWLAELLGLGLLALDYFSYRKNRGKPKGAQLRSPAP